MPVLLVTGFNPFQEFNRNPSEDIAKAVDGIKRSGMKVKGLVLPVSWSDAWHTLQETVEKTKPVAWLGFGLAPDPFIRLETTARNQAHNYHDEFGKLPPQHVSGEIIPGNILSIASTLPLKWLRETLLIRNFGIVENYPLEVRYSDDAGGYICNYVFYMAMNEFLEKVPIRGFIHVPPYANHAIPGSPSDKDIVDTGIFIVDTLINWIAEKQV